MSVGHSKKMTPFANQSTHDLRGGGGGGRAGGGGADLFVPIKINKGRGIPKLLVNIVKE